MQRTITHLRTALWWGFSLALLAAVIIGVGRAIVWNIEHEVTTGLTGPAEVHIWASDIKGFGGYSALVIAKDGASIIVGSDKQHYLTGRLPRNAAERITQVSDITHWPILYGSPDTVTPFKGDLEALTRLPDGRVGMAFEGYTRVEILARPGAVPTGLHRWDTFESLFGNVAFEALATLPDGTLLAVLERAQAGPHTQAYHYDGTSFAGPHPFPVTRGFSVTGADVGPDGCLYILERRYGVFTGFQFQLIRMRPSPPWTEQARTLLYRTQPMQMGNGEGVSMWQRGTTLIASIITDDGFAPLTPTRLIELPLHPAQARDCADQ